MKYFRVVTFYGVCTYREWMMAKKISGKLYDSFSLLDIQVTTRDLDWTTLHCWVFLVSNNNDDNNEEKDDRLWR